MNYKKVKFKDYSDSVLYKKQNDYYIRKEYYKGCGTLTYTYFINYKNYILEVEWKFADRCGVDVYSKNYGMLEKYSKCKNLHYWVEYGIWNNIKIEDYKEKEKYDKYLQKRMDYLIKNHINELETMYVTVHKLDNTNTGTILEHFYLKNRVYDNWNKNENFNERLEKIRKIKSAKYEWKAPDEEDLVYVYDNSLD